MVRTTYDSDDNSDDEGSVSESDNDDAMVESFEEQGLDIECVLNKMSITPRNSFKFKHERMPSRIRPSTSPESL